jgi:16S rRNA (cytosine967-C5)-methyltransferase
VVADAREPQSFYDGKPFDRVLVDAPCSSTGVIRRHPDIKLLRRAADIPALAATQLALLQSCFSMLAPGGRLVYGSCSVLLAENEQVIERFLEAEPRAKADAPASMPPGAILKSTGFQLLPGAAAGPDGFYYACLEKTTTGT